MNKTSLSSDKMNPHSRWLVLVASLSLLAVFFFPLWTIELWAPQYPEGLSMSIWISKFTGHVQTINILNHYIGMAPITEASFPELKYFPILFGIFIVTGVLVAAFGRKIFSIVYLLALLTFALGSMYDFYQWEYKFGHNLKSDAPIKMEDMVYQPPLIGEKTFLNITAASWPDIAGLAFALSIVLNCIAVLLNLEFIQLQALSLKKSQTASHTAYS